MPEKTLNRFFRDLSRFGKNGVDNIQRHRESKRPLFP